MLFKWRRLGEWMLVELTSGWACSPTRATIFPTSCPYRVEMETFSLLILCIVLEKLPATQKWPVFSLGLLLWRNTMTKNGLRRKGFILSSGCNP